MAVPPYMGCPEKVHWMDSEDTGQWLCNACSQFNWCLLLLSNKVLQPDWMACNFPSKLCFGWRVVRQSRHSSVDSRWIWLLVKPLLYKDKMASAPTQKHLSDGLSEGGVEDFWYKHCIARGAADPYFWVQNKSYLCFKDDLAMPEAMGIKNWLHAWNYLK